MNIILSDTFSKSISNLDKQSQDIVKQTFFDFQINPKNPGFKFHRLERTTDKNFWSIYVNQDIRIIVHKKDNNIIFCYTDHHDKAYNWAKNRKIENNSYTGTIQLIQIQEIQQKVYKKVEDAPPLFQKYSKDYILKIGVPENCLDSIYIINNPDDILTLIDYIPQEVVERLLDLSEGKIVPISPKIDTNIYKVAEDSAAYSFDSKIDTSILYHPETRSHFCIINTHDELKRILEEPLERWAVFLHPDQRAIVEKNINGPMKVTGSAGTGKTVVALHRTVYLAKQNKEPRILLTTFSRTLALRLEKSLNLLLPSNSPARKFIDILKPFWLNF